MSLMTPRLRSMSSRCFFRRALRLMSPPSVLIELAVYFAPSIHITPDPNPMVDAQTTPSRAGRF